ncbi:PEP-CTERM sorting domain-containing protein [Oceaniferula spumae]
MKYTIAVLAVTTIAANAATVTINHGDPNSGLHTNHAGPIYGQTITSHADALRLDDVTFQVRDGNGGQSATGTLAFLHVYDSVTFNTSTGAITAFGNLIGVSDNSVNNSVDATDLGALTWNFTNTAVTGSTQYFFLMSTNTDAGNTADLTPFTNAATGLELEAPGGYADGTALVANNVHNTGLGWDLNFEANFNTEAVPEPSSAALIGLGGLALIFRRRK